jgi:hypothetical protein
MLNEGRAKDLLDLLNGESAYSINQVHSNLPGRTGSREKDIDELHTVRMATEHVWFITRFGLNIQNAKEDGKYYSAYPEYFERWLNAGCLGISEEELAAYLKEHPI